MLSPWTILILLGPPFLTGSAGCVLLLHAGSAYAGGRAGDGRRQGRRAGWLVFVGGLALAVIAAAVALSGAGLPGAAALPGAAMAAAAGLAGLLGGLSGKPRPADGFATALHLAGAACLAAAA